jgi:hypothetical protein
MLTYHVKKNWDLLLIIASYQPTGIKEGGYTSLVVRQIVPQDREPWTSALFKGRVLYANTSKANLCLKSCHDFCTMSAKCFKYEIALLQLSDLECRRPKRRNPENRGLRTGTVLAAYPVQARWLIPGRLEFRFLSFGQAFFHAICTKIPPDPMVGGQDTADYAENALGREITAYGDTNPTSRVHAVLSDIVIFGIIRT